MRFRLPIAGRPAAVSTAQVLELPAAPVPAVHAAAGVGTPSPETPPTAPLPAASAARDADAAPYSVASRLLGAPVRQLTGADVRAERLVQSVRSEVERLREQLADLCASSQEMTQADIEAIVADPDAAAGLPPALLVRAVVTLHERSAALDARVDRLRGKLHKARERKAELENEQAWSRGRLETLEQVIAALHENLEDLRTAERRERQPADRPEQLGHGASPRALRASAQAAGERSDPALLVPIASGEA